MFLLLLWFLPTSASQTDTQDTFAAIPPAYRTTLQLRLADLISAERNQDWNQLYGLLDPDDYLRGQSRDEFIRSRTEFAGPGRSVVIDFSVVTCREDSAGFENCYELWGCAETRWKGETHHWQSCVTAYLSDGTWYFSEIQTVFTAVGGSPAPCSEREGPPPKTTPN
jgi:hypothetical protein